MLWTILFRLFVCLFVCLFFFFFFFYSLSFFSFFLSLFLCSAAASHHCFVLQNVRMLVVKEKFCVSLFCCANDDQTLFMTVGFQTNRVENREYFF